jgi:protocatechuate 3,4-dioxygenase beta subunit
MTLIWRGFAVLALAAVPALVGAQPPTGSPADLRQQNRPLPPRAAGQQVEIPRGTAIIRGAVVAADNGSPIRRAQVRVSGQGAGGRMVTTDAQGRFEVRDLPAGRFTVSASKAGFVTLQYGQRRPSESGTPLELADAQMIDKLVIALPRGSVISGRISDEFGEPVANANVQAMRFGYQAGARRLLPVGGQNARDTTDDQGQFRLFGLSPGEYIVSASLRTGGGDANDPDAENTGYAPTYFPGTANITEAQRVAIGVSQEQGGIMFSLIATRLVRVSGAVVNSQGAPVTAGNVMLTPAGSRLGTGAMAQSMGGRIEQGGQFRIMNVPPGRYVAQVRTVNPRAGPGGPAGRGGVLDGSNEFGRQEITVGAEDMDGVVLITAPGARVTGQVVSDAGAVLAVKPQQVSVGSRVLEIDPTMPGANVTSRVNNDWSFEINGVFEPRVFRANLPQGWNLKAVMLNGQDITDTPLDVSPGQLVSGVQIVITDKMTELNGRITDARGAAVTDATVVVFAADEARWSYQSRFVRTARPDQEGRFQIRGLPPYEKYLAVAVQGLEDGQAGDAEFLTSVRERAASFSLSESEIRTLDLRWSGR